MGDTLIVKSAVKGAAKYDGKQLNVGGDVADKLNDIVADLIAKACARSVNNGRTTLQAKDL